MAKSRAASFSFEGAFSASAVAEVASRIRGALDAPANVGFAFVSPGYLEHVQEFCEILRVDGHIVDVIGTTAAGNLDGGVEHEGGEGFSVLALAIPGAGIPVAALSQDNPGDAAGLGARAGVGKIEGWIAFANPFTFDVEPWLAGWTPSSSGIPVVGGLASGGRSAEECAVFLNGRPVDCVVAGVSAPARLVPVLNQGCRPIGEPLTVTRAQENVIFALGARPAYEALESAFETLSDKEKSTARGNLFAGLAGTEYVDDFRPGDFMVRNILGADPNSGAVVIGGIPRVGQTVQYQLRDALSAESELNATLRRVSAEWGAPAASLIFACTGRGKNFFGDGGNDAGSVQKALGVHPSAGFFCGGEIGPVGRRNCVHSHSLACAILMESASTP